jgi:Na+/alanine symporter
MWLVALLGGASAFIESTLAQLYEVPDGNGGCRGGPAYYIEKVLGSRGLALLFSVFLILTYIVGFNMVASYNLMDAFSGYSFFSPTTTPTVVGVVLAVLTALCIMGGSQRLSRVTGVLVPVMGGIYVLAALVMIVLHIGLLPGVIAAIFRNAFDFKAIFRAGFTGSDNDAQAYKRELISNEAGNVGLQTKCLGWSTITPGQNGIGQMISVFNKYNVLIFRKAK